MQNIELLGVSYHVMGYNKLYVSNNHDRRGIDMLYGDKAKKKEAGAAPEPERKNEREKRIEYVKLIEQMNDETFKLCLKKLYPLFNYSVINMENMRKIDLEDQLERIQDKFYKNSKGKNKGFLNYYLDILKKYYDVLIECDDKAERCRNRGREVIQNAVSKDGTRYDIEDGIILLLCLYREKSKGIKVINDVNTSASTDDIEYIDKIVEYRIQQGKNLVKKTGMIKNMIADDSDSEFDSKVFYVNSVLFFCMGMQDRGVIV